MRYNYFLSIANGSPISAHAIVSGLEAFDSPAAKQAATSVRTLCEIGMEYSNHDFDVLSAAHRVLVAEHEAIDERAERAMELGFYDADPHAYRLRV